MYRIMFFFAVLALANVCASAQDFNEIYASFRQQAIEKYRTFRTRCNMEYAEFVEKAWQQYNVLPSIESPVKDMPTPPMPYNGEEDSIKDKELQYSNIIPVAPPVPQPTPIEPILEQPQPKEEQFTFLFFGTEGKVRLSDRHRFKLSDTSEKSVADAWRALSDDKYNNVIRDCLELRLKHGLCDWAYLQMLVELCNEYLGKDTNEATLLTAYLYCQSGYKMRFGRGTNGRLYLMVNSRHDIYNIPYYQIAGEKYYPLNCSKQPLYICEVSYPKEQPLSLEISTEMKISDMLTEARTLQSIQYPQLKVSVHANKNLMSFYDTYPSSQLGEDFMTRWAMYAQTPLDVTTREKLYAQLTSLISGKNELEAANMLLNLVQTGFTYKYDDEVWGGDRVFFAEESLAYPYCDCEDRSILFSHLMRDLLGLDVALVYSPGHLFTAVKFSDNVEGTHISIGEEKYVVCEPTCTNGAPVGWISSESRNSDVEVIKLSKIDYDKNYRLSLKEPEYKRSLFPVCINEKYGYKDAEGKIVVPCEYDSLVDSEQGDKFLYGAVRSNTMTLFDYDGVEQIHNVEGYIPLDVNRDKDGFKGDYFAILKTDGEWYYRCLVTGPLPNDFCFSEYDMEDISYEKNIYCEPHSEEKKITDKYIILHKKDSNKYGVLKLNSENSVIPFEYDSISFVSGDKSKVRVYKSENNQYQEFSLKSFDLN